MDLDFSCTKSYPSQVKRHSLTFQVEAALKYLVVLLTFAHDCTYEWNRDEHVRTFKSTPTPDLWKARIWRISNRIPNFNTIGPAVAEFQQDNHSRYLSRGTRHVPAVLTHVSRCWPQYLCSRGWDFPPGKIACQHWRTQPSVLGGHRLPARGIEVMSPAKKSKI